jgi:hypothetical protein
MDDHSIVRSSERKLDDRVVHSPHVRYVIYDVLDERGRRSDNIWILKGKVFDWNQYKLLAETPHGSVSVHQRFQPEAPEGNPWDDFVLDPDDGETGQLLDDRPGGLSVEQLHLVYMYESDGLVTASYDGSGRVVRCSAESKRRAHFEYPPLDEFESVGLPARVSTEAAEPPLSEGLAIGPGKLVSVDAPSYPLVHILLVRQFDLGRIFEVVEFNAKRHLLKRRWIRFAGRPYDAAIRDANRNVDR